MTSLAYGALWLFCFAVPWENMIEIPGLGTISKLLGVVAIGCALLAALLRGQVRRWSAFHFLALAFVMYAALGSYRGIYEVEAFGKAKTFIQLFLVLWMIWELAPNPKRQRGLLFAYVCGAYVGAVATIMVYRAEVTARRFAAEGFDPNDLGMTLALAVPMAWYLGMTFKNPLLRWVSRGYIPIGLWGIGLTGSRGASVATLVALAIVPLTMTKLSPGRMVAGILILIASGATAISFIPQQSWDRLGTTRAEVQEGTLNSRLIIWKAGIRAFTQKPFTGYGTASFPTATQQVAGFRRGAHNTFLTVLVEQGLLGFLIFISMIGVIVRRAQSLPTIERRYAFVQLATLMVAMLPLGWDDRKPVWMILAILSAMAAVVASIHRMPTAVPQPSPRPRAVASRRPIAT